MAISEAQFLKQVLELAKHRGWLRAHFRAAQTKSGNWITAVQGDGKGFPDLVLVRHQIIVAELKVGRNKPTTEQSMWLQAFAKTGTPAFIWTPKDWPEIERVLENGDEIDIRRKDAGPPQIPRSDPIRRRSPGRL